MVGQLQVLSVWASNQDPGPFHRPADGQEPTIRRVLARGWLCVSED